MPARIVCTVLFGSSCVLCFSIIKNVDEFSNQEPDADPPALEDLCESSAHVVSSGVQLRRKEPRIIRHHQPRLQQPLPPWSLPYANARSAPPTLLLNEVLAANDEAQRQPQDALL